MPARFQSHGGGVAVDPLDVEFEESFDVDDELVAGPLTTVDTLDAADALAALDFAADDGVDMADDFGTADLDAQADDGLDLAESLRAIDLANWAELLTIGDAFGPVTQMSDLSLMVADEFGTFDLDADMAESLPVADAHRTVSFIDLGSSEDTFLEQQNPNLTRGDSDFLWCRNANALGNNQRVAYITWDLTGIDGTPSGDMTFTFQVRRTDGLTNATLNFSVLTSATKPFEEDTATWNGDEPIGGDGFAGWSWGNLGTSFVTRSYIVPQADVDQFIGRWALFRFVGETGLGNTTNFEIRPKEAPADPPILNFDLVI